MNYTDEFPIATGPTNPDYDPAEEQKDNLLKAIGLELNMALDKKLKEKLLPDGDAECVENERFGIATAKIKRT